MHVVNSVLKSRGQEVSQKGTKGDRGRGLCLRKRDVLKTPCKMLLKPCAQGKLVAHGIEGGFTLEGSTRLASGNGAGTANDVNVTTKILAGNFFRHPAPQK